MRKKSEFLEHHRRLMATKLPQLRFVHLDDVDAVHEDFANRRIDQSVDVTDEGRLSGARKSHDHLNVAGGNFDVDVLQSENMRCSR